MSASDAATEAVAGAAGSILATALTYPLKTIYTLKALDTSSASASGSVQSGPEEFSSFAAKVLALFSSGKWRFLYAGFKPTVIETGMSSGVYFYLYSMLRQLAVRRRSSTSSSSQSQSVSVAESLVIAALAGAGNMLVTCPAQVVATQMQAQHMHNPTSSQPRNLRSPWETIKDVYRESGVLGFWKGLVPSLILVVNPAIQYMLYEQLVRVRRLQRAAALGRKPGSVKLEAADVFAISAVAKLGATVFTYPMIVVKSRLQAVNSSRKELQYSSTWDAISTILRQEGVAGFFKGLDTKLLQTVLNAALLMMMKEQIGAATRRALVKGRG